MGIKDGPCVANSRDAKLAVVLPCAHRVVLYGLCIIFRASTTDMLNEKARNKKIYILF
jgi:hypothetical protein